MRALDDCESVPGRKSSSWFSLPQHRYEPRGRERADIVSPALRFEFELPFRERDSAAAQRNPRPHGPGGIVLVADDQRQWRAHRRDWSVSGAFRQGLPKRSGAAGSDFPASFLSWLRSPPRFSLKLQQCRGRNDKQHPDQGQTRALFADPCLEARRKGALHADRHVAVAHTWALPASKSAAPASTMLTHTPIAVASATWATISAAIIRVRVIPVLLCLAIESSEPVSGEPRRWQAREERWRENDSRRSGIFPRHAPSHRARREIGRASCRERV